MVVRSGIIIESKFQLVKSVLPRTCGCYFSLPKLPSLHLPIIDLRR
jgi:hypothetical protein